MQVSSSSFGKTEMESGQCVACVKITILGIYYVHSSTFAIHELRALEICSGLLQLSSG